MRELYDRWPWSIEPDRTIRTATPEGEELDPITAVCATVHGRLFDLSSYRQAAKLLGIDSDTADRIVEAADLAGSYNAHVRADLCEALRLSEMWGREGKWNDVAFHRSPYPHQYDRPIRPGVGSVGSVNAAMKKARWSATSKILPVASRWRLIVRIAEPVAALSISSACGGLVPASSSAFSVGICRPGFSLSIERVAAD